MLDRGVASRNVAYVHRPPYVGYMPTGCTRALPTHCQTGEYERNAMYCLFTEHGISARVSWWLDAELH